MSSSDYKPGRSAVASSNYGSMYISGAVSTGVNASNYTKASGSTVLGSSNNFDMPSNNRLRYLDTSEIDFHVNVAISSECDTPNTLIHYALAKNGTVIENAAVDRHHASAGDHGASSINWIISLSQNDYIELFIKAGGSVGLTVDHLLMTIIVV